MAVMPWGETITVLMDIGILVDRFTIGSATDGVIGSDYIGGRTLVEDVSEFVTDISTSRGRTDQLQQFNAGTASLTLLNSDRRFDPTNEDSPYWDDALGRSAFTPRKSIKIISTATLSRTIFTGVITDIDIEYKPQSVNASTDISTVTISASDDFLQLANTFINPEYEPVQSFSGNRLLDVLQLPSVNFPATKYNVPVNYGKAILGGAEFDPLFTVSAGTNALSYLQKINEAEQGYLFMSRDGVLTFVERLEPAFQLSVAEFADDGTGIPYNTLSVAFGQESLYNNITISNVAGLEFSLSDDASADDFGISTLELSDTLLAGSVGGLTEQLDLLAQNLLLRYKKPEYRFDKMTVTMNGLTSNQRFDIKKLELSDVITITRTYPVGTPASVTQKYSVESLRHIISPSTHRVEIGLAVAPLAFPLILDDVVFGTLSENNALEGTVGV